MPTNRTKTRIGTNDKNYNHLTQQLLNYLFENHDHEFNRVDIVEIIRTDLGLDYCDQYILTCLNMLTSSGLIKTTNDGYPKYYAVNYDAVSDLEIHIKNMKL